VVQTDDHTIKKPTAKPVMQAKGDGLYIRRRGSSASWVFRFQAAGRRQDIYLGVETAFTHREAKEVVREMHRAIARGENPKAVLNRNTAPRTVAEAIDGFVEAAAPGWRSKTERKHTENQLRSRLKDLLKRPIAQVGRDDILPILEAAAPSPSVYRRLLYRTRAVFLREHALKHIDRQPVEWDALRYIIRPAVKAVKHHPAVSWRNAPVVWRNLAHRITPAANCLKLLILTGVRSGEARGAYWQEFDLERAIWTIPEPRTKTGKELVVPLSRQVMNMLEIIPRARSVLLFPGRTGKPLTDMGLLKEQRLLDKVANVHGWRSSFRDWGSENEKDPVLLELSLGHAVGGAVERAYARSNLVELRRPLMQSWADHITGAR
jgi:integrase